MVFIHSYSDTLQKVTAVVISLILHLFNSSSLQILTQIDAAIDSPANGVLRNAQRQALLYKLLLTAENDDIEAEADLQMMPHTTNPTTKS